MVHITNNLFLFRDKNYSYNSYLISDLNGNLVAVDPSEDTAKQMLKPLEEDSEEIESEETERFLAIILTSKYLVDYEGIKLILNKYPDAKIYVGIEDLSDLKKQLEEIEISINNLEALTERIEIGEMILTTLKAPGISKGSYVIRYKKFFLTGETLLVNKMTDLTVAGIDKEELKNTLKALVATMRKDFYVCPMYGDITSLAVVLLRNLELKQFLEEEEK